MGGRTVSPGGALLRTSRMFSIPKPLPDPPSASFSLGEQQSTTMTRPHPKHQTITSPLASREKGDWGLKRPLPLKTTLATSTPLFRFKQIDTIEGVTDFNSSADHSLSLEKFQELRVAMSVPSNDGVRGVSGRTDAAVKSVFEEDIDVTDHLSGKNDQRWKFKGPWLAHMTEGEFINYLNKKVRPKRVEFRALLRESLAENLTTRQNSAALEAGTTPPPRIQAQDITESQFSDYIRSLRNDRVTLYALVSKFLDLAPLGKPIGITQSSMFFVNESEKVAGGPYAKSGPPPSHPSAGISYLRTNSFMENHPVYGPQGKKSPTLSRIVYPRSGPSPAKLGVGGFVATVPSGDNDFNIRAVRSRGSGKKPLAGIQHLDISSYGGAKAYVEPHTASIDPDGKVVLRVRETSAEAQVVAKELKGQAKIYNDAALKRSVPQPQEERPEIDVDYSAEAPRLDKIAEEVLPEASGEEIIGSSSSYGLEPPTEKS